MTDYRQMAYKYCISNDLEYWKVDNTFAKKHGNETAIFYANLLEEEKRAYEQQKTDSDGFFSLTASGISESTNIQPKKQAKITEYLIKLGLIERKLKGLPATNWFKINYKNHYYKVMRYE